MLGKKKGKATTAVEAVLKEAFKALPVTQRWVSVNDLKEAAAKLDGNKKRL